MAENRLIGIDEASKLTGLSPYHIRKGIKSGRFPVFQMAAGGKYLLDIQLLASVLAGEAMDNIGRGYGGSSDTDTPTEPGLTFGCTDDKQFLAFVSQLSEHKEAETDGDGFGDEGE